MLKGYVRLHRVKLQSALAQGKQAASGRCHLLKRQSMLVSLWGKQALLRESDKYLPRPPHVLGTGQSRQHSCSHGPGVTGLTVTWLRVLGKGRCVYKGAPSHTFVFLFCFLNKGTQTNVHHQDTGLGEQNQETSTWWN